MKNDRLPVQLILGYGGRDGESLLICPCEHEDTTPNSYLHLISSVVDGKDAVLCFGCEYCGDEVELVIEFHKGQTFTHMRTTGRRWLESEPQPAVGPTELADDEVQLDMFEKQENPPT